MPTAIDDRFDALNRAIVDTVDYYDLLDYPLTAVELQHYLGHLQSPGLEGLKARCLKLAAGGTLSLIDEYVVLKGREQLVETREKNACINQRNWKRARFFIRLFGFVPFVRLVAVSGSLALDRSNPESDIDVFIVAGSGRIWFVRAMCVFISRIFGSYRTEQQVSGRLCLNHFVTDDAMLLDHRNLYTARLFSHLVPGYGLDCYHAFQKANLWIRDLIVSYPWDNYPPFQVMEAGGVSSHLKRAGERVLSGRLGGFMEQAVKRFQLGRIAHDQRRLDERAQIVLSDQVLRFHLQAQEPVMLSAFQRKMDQMARFTNQGAADTLEKQQNYL